MSRVELKNWAKDKIKGHIWELLVPILVAGILTGLTVGQQYTMDGGTLKVEGGVSLGIFFYFVQVGLIWFMVKFINDQPHEFKDLFHFTNDYVRIFLVNLLQLVFYYYFVYFHRTNKDLNDIIDVSVNRFIIDKEYLEFVNLLNSTNCCI